MFKSILAALQIRKEIPDAIGYNTFGPATFTIPKEFQEALDSPNIASKDINVFYIRVDNYSSKIMKEIRILYSGDFSYSPNLKFRRRDVQVQFELKADQKELVIAEIPPNESVFIEIFDPLVNFEIFQVISNNEEITGLMQKLAWAKRYPEIARMKLISYVLMLVVVLALMFFGYVVWKTNRNTEQINAAYAGFLSCTPSLIDDPAEQAASLKNRFGLLSQFWRNIILSTNKVKTFEELKLKSKIIWCEPNNSNN